MVFSSVTFIFLILPFFLALDCFARAVKIPHIRNALLILVSLIFYIWGEAFNVFILIFLGIINYVAGNYIYEKKSKTLLITLIIVNLLVLGVTKYLFWFLSLFIHEFADKEMHMPLGISFFTFHAVSYIIDVYRRSIKPARNVVDFLTYFCMFPHLVAGPIVRYKHVQEDMATRGPDKDLFVFGLYRFLLGLNKKVIIANSVAVLADVSFSLSTGQHLFFFDAWIGIVAYAIQIYFDFSGYSDMAIGLAAMGGFRFEENFKRPYSAISMRDFWQRWHISLSSWLKDYLYIPLGGSKKSNLLTYRNLLLVFFLCGLWHGANTTFILWGLWHGTFLIAERFSWLRILQRMPRPLMRAYTLLIVLIGWVFFRAENLDAAFAYLHSMFSFDFSPVILSYYTGSCAALAVGTLFCLFPDRLFPQPTSHSPRAFSFSLYAVQILFSVISVAFLLINLRNPFIYFNF